MENFFKFLRKYSIFLLLLISSIPLVGYIHQGMPVLDDGQDHVARIANFYQALTDGVIVPRWAARLNWGYGHPVLMFLYPLSGYFGSFLHMIGFSFVDSVKIIFMISYLASIVFMYVWAQKQFNKTVGIIAAVLYGFAPYRFVDLYVRGAIGEHVAFVFPPLLFLFLFELARANKARFGIGISLSMAGFILAHNAVSLMYLPIIGVYVLYLFFFKTKRSMSYLLAVTYYILLGFGLSAFFWIPALIEGKYTLRDIVTKGEALTRFVSWKLFLYSPWSFGQGNETTKFFGLPQWFGILGSIGILLSKRKLSVKPIIGVLLLLLFLYTWMMTSASAVVWNKVMILQNFQFPWRFQCVTVFLTAVLSGIVVEEFLKHVKTLNRQFILMLFCFMAILFTHTMWYPRGYQYKPESFYTGIYQSTTDTGESSPIWSVRFMEHTPVRPIEVLSGEAEIQSVRRTSIEHVYNIKASNPSSIVENTLFFPGWKVFVDGIQTGIQYQDPAYRGLMTFRVDEGAHTVRVIFTTTKVRTYAEYITILSLMLLGGTGIIMIIWRKK